MKTKELHIPVIPLDESILAHELYIIDHVNLTGSSPRNIGFIPVTELYTVSGGLAVDENAEIEAPLAQQNEHVAEPRRRSLGIKVAALAHGEQPTNEEKELLLKHGILAYTYDLIPLALSYCAEGYTLCVKAYIPKLPEGYSLTGFHAGIKAANKQNKLDLGIIYSQEPCSWAGVFTKNAVKAACIETNTQLLNKKVYGIIANSGNANCCNGDLGLEADLELKSLLKDFLKQQYKLETDVLSASTGVIGRTLELSSPRQLFHSAMHEYLNRSLSQNTNDKLNRGLALVEDIYNFAKAIMTTDLVPKISQDKKQHFLGIAKGSGMIAPNMATMLAFIVTDVKIDGLNEQETQLLMQKTLSELVNETFNNISVDGDTSTNDMVILLNNFSGKTISINEFKSSLREVCESLCYQIIADGEGLTKIIDLELTDLPVIQADLQKIGKNIINSMLVKTAIFGADPNWGRIVAAFAREEDLLAGLDIKYLEVYLLNQCVFKDSRAQLFGDDLDALSKLMKSSKHINIKIKMAESYKALREKDSGLMALASGRFLGNDLSYDYVKINAEYTS